MKKLLKYFKESHQELKKVVWPSREAVISSTKVVLVSTVIVAIFLGLVDFLLLKGVLFIL
ncbi:MULTISPECIES: preprotein translocase subunit SecE [Sphaerochaeta]|jgi:preprotein translocase subunit SecE|uniref:Protein translocase subunit SecE n=2 Tax=root TaxID=1 RepID=A0ABY4D9S4_9SPIR|nr:MULTISPECIES: preprotein translocase subunit SecE [Sphaerochaeta]MDT3358791.1 preprotein translocase subunit SecE [Spirochaetota bacterium]NLA96697.1 preprotein translocase subunit SecE [Spirochaetales bacterium]HAP55040.1 preprotein translocase subunit SecE [Spirochaetaceae bacterium]MDD2394109.1 preprotein translocase subunit SecE [Sphaerochaeta sp.]MDD3423574.1 preprotein translocase subunit SecE [Sphaerochaeta sp.]